MNARKIGVAAGLAASASVMALATAFAADLPSRKAPLLPPPPVFTWDGFYLGVNAGYTTAGSNGFTTAGGPDGANVGTGGVSSAVGAALATTSFPLRRQDGFIGGVQAGVNKQFGMFVVGWEEDIQVMGGNRGRGGAIGALPDPLIGANLVQVIGASRKVDWLSTSRARAGYLVTPTFLLYGTAGFASGGTKSSVLISQSYPGTGIATGIGGAGYSQTRVGYTFGGGAEWMFAPNWSVKAEYIYYDLGRVNYQTTLFTTTAGGAPISSASALASTRFSGHIGRIGLNYHWDWANALRGPLGGLAPAAPVALAWDGLYFGANAGYGWSQNNGFTSVGAPNANDFANPAISGTAAALATFQLPVSSKGGFALGGQVGSNYQFGSLVVGAESDFTKLFANSMRGAIVSSTVDATTGTTGVQTAAAEKRVEWLSTSRLRAGYLVTPTFLLYATGGMANGGVKARTIISQSAPAAGVGAIAVGAYSQTRVGYTFGGGGEWMFLPNWSLKGEYLYYDLGRVNTLVSPLTIPFPGAGGAASSASAVSSTRFNGHVARAGINYHWNWGSVAPVVARY